MGGRLEGPLEHKTDALGWVLADDVAAVNWQGFTFVQVVDALGLDEVALRARFMACARSRSAVEAAAGTAGSDGDAGAGIAGTTEQATLSSVA